MSRVTFTSFQTHLEKISKVNRKVLWDFLEKVKRRSKKHVFDLLFKKKLRSGFGKTCYEPVIWTPIFFAGLVYLAILSVATDSVDESN